MLLYGRSIHFHLFFLRLAFHDLHPSVGVSAALSALCVSNNFILDDGFSWSLNISRHIIGQDWAFLVPAVKSNWTWFIWRRHWLILGGLYGLNGYSSCIAWLLNCQRLGGGARSDWSCAWKLVYIFVTFCDGNGNKISLRIEESRLSLNWRCGLQQWIFLLNLLLNYGLSSFSLINQGPFRWYLAVNIFLELLPPLYYLFNF